MNTPPVPAVSKALVDYVSSVFPDRCPSSEMTEREVWMAAGAAKVARKLAAIHADQAKDSLTGK